jgi:hypothetical protein
MMLEYFEPESRLDNAGFYRELKSDITQCFTPRRDFMMCHTHTAGALPLRAMQAACDQIRREYFRQKGC